MILQSWVVHTCAIQYIFSNDTSHIFTAMQLITRISDLEDLGQCLLTPMDNNPSISLCCNTLNGVDLNMRIFPFTYNCQLLIKKTTLQPSQTRDCYKEYYESASQQNAKQGSGKYNQWFFFMKWLCFIPWKLSNSRTALWWLHVIPCNFLSSQCGLSHCESLCYSSSSPRFNYFFIFLAQT